MEPSEPSSISFIILLVLLILSGFFSSAEVALISLSPAKTRSLVRQNRKGAKAVEFLKNNPERLLITILIGNNLVNILIPVLSTVIFTKMFGDAILGIMTGILTLILLIFGEIAPKTLAQKHAERFSLFSGPPIFWMGKILSPIVIILEKITNILGGKKQQEKTFSDEELLALAEIGEEEGGLESDERARIENVLEFGETTAGEIMTPRPTMDTLSENTTLKEAIEYFLGKTHSRIPIYSKDIDHIIGIITLKDIFQFEQNHTPETPLKDLPKNQIFTIPMSMVLEDILREMKWRRTHMAIVIDEHGGTAGLVTLEDLLEEVFGNIEDETDVPTEEMKVMPDGSYLIPGNTEIQEVSEKIHATLPGEENDLIAKIILDTLGRFPKRGEKVQITKEVSIVVEKMTDEMRIMLFLSLFWGFFWPFFFWDFHGGTRYSGIAIKMSRFFLLKRKMNE